MYGILQWTSASIFMVIPLQTVDSKGAVDIATLYQPTLPVAIR